MRESLGFKFFFYIFLSLFCLVWLVPVVFLVFTSLKSNPDLVNYSWFLPPKNVQWGNFSQAWKEGNLSVYMRNSALLCLVKVPLGIIVAGLASFGLTRLRFRWENQIFYFILLGMMVPIQATLVPNKLLMMSLHLNDTLPGLLILYIAFGISFDVLILRGFIRTIPRELDDSALIDGCSSLGLFWRIIMPLSKPAVATLVILDTLGTWNELLLAVVFVQKNTFRTITVGLMHFKLEYTTDYTLLNAGVLISIIPVFTIFLIFQRFFVKGLAGALKG
jgi:raffinose/stachyose/melibiose transport system permease protein